MASTASQQQPPLPTPSSAFLARRAHLVSSIGDSLETVLSQINALNRSLEGIIEIGNEFASVEALWSQFEGVMGGDQGQSSSQGQQQGQQGEGDGKDGEGAGEGAGSGKS